jgi:uncharacterized double-CXXCG motif protein
MRLFRVQPDDANWGRQHDYEINAGHPWGLPGVRCSECGRTWATTGVAYPAIDCSVLPSAEGYSRAGTASAEKYREARDAIIEAFSVQLVLPPGTQFGSLVGTARGDCGDFAWVNPWTMLIRAEALARLEASGVSLPTAVPARLEFLSGRRVHLLEFQVEPVAHLSAASFSVREPSPCPSCGYDARKPERIVVARASIPSDVDLFRLRDFPATILAKERFADEAGRLELKDFVVSRVDVAE